MGHPITEAIASAREALKAVSDVNPTFMLSADKADSFRSLASLEAQLAEVRLRLLADADDLADETGATDAAAWLSHETRSRPETTRADLRLAQAIDRRYPAVGDALRAGQANLDQARVIVRALDALPSDLPSDTVVEAESALVGHAAHFDPRRHARLGRRILEVAAPEIADEVEGRRLAALEAEAEQACRLSLHRLGDGTTRLSGRLPDATATRLATYLQAFTSPRQGDTTSRPYPRRLGDAFCQLLEVVDPGRLPVHAGDATTLLVTIPLATLRAELGAADLVTGPLVPGDSPIADGLSAAETRRLACTARIIPAVLGGRSDVLDLGRSRRLFSSAQRKALLLRDQTCRAEGCDIPGTWAEAHHWEPWSSGGRTNLADGVLLCRHHHRRAHAAEHRAERLPSGAVRFHRRT